MVAKWGHPEQGLGCWVGLTEWAKSDLRLEPLSSSAVMHAAYQLCTLLSLSVKWGGRMLYILAVITVITYCLQNHFLV